MTIERWKIHSSPSSLSACLSFYAPNEPEMEKEIRSTFVTCEPTPDQFKENILNELELLTRYCANDVKGTKIVFSKIFPLYLDQYPSSISFFGSLIMGSPQVGVDTNLFDQNFNQENLIFEEKKKYINQRLAYIAQEVIFATVIRVMTHSIVIR